MAIKLYILAKDLLNNNDLTDFRSEVVETTDKSSAEAVLVSIDTKLNLRDFPKLRYILSSSTGIDHLPKTSINKRACKIIYLDTKKSDDFFFLKNEIWSTTQHTIGLIISLLRNYKEQFSAIEKGLWGRASKGESLKDKEIGILGVGRIGTQMIKICEALKMKVYAIRSKNLSCYAKTISFVDIVSIHLGLNPETVNYVDKEFIKKMKKGSYLINTARAEIVNEADIVKALESGHIKGYAADVCLIEKGKISPVFKNKNMLNILLTPHVGGYTIEDTKKTALFVLRKMLDFERTKSISAAKAV